MWKLGNTIKKMFIHRMPLMKNIYPKQSLLMDSNWTTARSLPVSQKTRACHEKITIVIKTHLLWKLFRPSLGPMSLFLRTSESGQRRWNLFRKYPQEKSFSTALINNEFVDFTLKNWIRVLRGRYYDWKAARCLNPESRKQRSFYQHHTLKILFDTNSRGADAILFNFPMS